MSIVKIKDKTFKTSITEDVIKARVKEVAQQISKDMAGPRIRVRLRQERSKRYWASTKT